MSLSLDSSAHWDVSPRATAGGTAVRAELVRVAQHHALDEPMMLSSSNCADTSPPIWRHELEPQSLLQDGGDDSGGTCHSSQCGGTSGGDCGGRAGRSLSIINVQNDDVGSAAGHKSKTSKLIEGNGSATVVRASPARMASHTGMPSSGSSGGRYALSQSWFKKKLLAESSEGSDDDLPQVASAGCLSLNLAMRLPSSTLRVADVAYEPCLSCAPVT